MNTHNNHITCNWCNQPAVIVWVHGHGQCSACGTNIDECCRGESCQSPASETNEKPDNLTIDNSSNNE